MPIYEYICTECDRLFEKLHRSGEEDQEVQCPSCGQKSVRRVLSNFSSFFPAGDSSCGPGRSSGFG